MAAAPKKTKKYHRILCSRPTLDAVNLQVTPTLTGQVGRKLTQEEVTDALIAVGRAHLDEVAALLTPDTPEDTPQ